MGTRACAGGRWGACTGTDVISTRSISSPSLKMQALGGSQPCPSSGPLANPCDPYCNQFVDDPGGLTLDGGVTNSSGGITIPGASGSSTCDYVAPSNAASAYSVLPTAWQPRPSPCAGTGVTERCGADSYCNAGQCEPFSAGGTYDAVSGTCASSWDLTFGLPCKESGDDTITICNRGGVAANSGTVTGVVQDASLAGRPTDVTLYKSLGNAVKKGTCSLNLGTSPIGPGQCRSVTLASLCPAADFGSGSGMRTIQWNMPDWSGGSDPSRVNGECSGRNNYTVYVPAAVLSCQGVDCTVDGAVVEPTVMTSAGVSNCSGGTNQGGPAPTSGADGCSLTDYYNTCKQDHRCVDSTPNRCQWNGGEGWKEPACNGIDITVGAPCGSAGSEPSKVPFCNRGSQPVPAGTVLDFYKFNPQVPNATKICDPASNGGAKVCSYTVPAGGLQPGKCGSVECTNSNGNKYIVVKPSIAECTMGANNACRNNVAYWKTDGSPGCASCDGSACTTTVTGKVYDPSGAGSGTNNLPLAGVTVFQPYGPLTTFTEGVACDSCASLASPSIATTVTDSSGSFTLTGVTPGAATPIVVQSGRWRRQVNVNVTACTTTAIPNGTLRMPRNRTEGDIPKIAVAMQGDESLECFLRKVGISESEMKPTSSPSDVHRIHLYEANGLVTSPVAQTLDTVWASTANLNAYNAIVLGCDGVGPYSGSDARSRTPNATEKQRIKDYADIGGRIFNDHWSGHDLIALGPAPWPSTATWLDGASTGVEQRAKVLTTTPKNQLFADWLDDVGNIGAWLEIDQRRNDVSAIQAPAIEWLRGSSNWGSFPDGNRVMSYSFETPFNAGSTCGRVVHNGMHVSEGRDGNQRPRDFGSTTNRFDSKRKKFPDACVLDYALTEEEKALEYQFFQLTACEVGGEPPPPPAAPLSDVVFARDYEATCPIGHSPTWGYFYWQSTIAPGTSIQFRAATADTLAALPAAPPPVAPATVGAGTATTTVTDPSWGRDLNTVAWHLENDSPGPAQESKRWLRIYMTFKPLGSVAPVLHQWRQTYSCVPTE